MKTLRKFGDRVSAGGGCAAAVTARTRCGWITFRECGELLYVRFPLKLKGDVYKEVSKASNSVGSEAWYLKEWEIYKGHSDPC